MYFARKKRGKKKAEIIMHRNGKWNFNSQSWDQQKNREKWVKLSSNVIHIIIYSNRHQKLKNENIENQINCSKRIPTASLREGRWSLLYFYNRREKYKCGTYIKLLYYHIVMLFNWWRRSDAECIQITPGRDPLNSSLSRIKACVSVDVDEIK